MPNIEWAFLQPDFSSRSAYNLWRRPAADQSPGRPARGEARS